MAISSEDKIENALDKHVEFITALASFAEEIATLFFLEVKLAAASLKYIVLYTIFLLFALFSFWLITLVTVIWLSHLWLGGWFFPLLIAGGVNLIFITLLTWRLFHYRRNLNFEHTRKCLFH